tara:strand:+ start:212 stop:424 length:213 start_codon:yes stop_codon:yes gene_type:complete
MEHLLEEVAEAVEALVAQVVVMEQLLKVVDRVHFHYMLKELLELLILAAVAVAVALMEALQMVVEVVEVE